MKTTPVTRKQLINAYNEYVKQHGEEPRFLKCQVLSDWNPKPFWGYIEIGEENFSEDSIAYVDEFFDLITPTVPEQGDKDYGFSIIGENFYFLKNR